MVKLFVELLAFLLDYAQFIVSLIILAVTALVLHRSIKKHANIYYAVLSIPLILIVVQLILALAGSLFNFYKLPVLGEIIGAYCHMIGFGYPLLVIIMYIGALNPKINAVKKLMSIRKELSIIVGFPILAHAIIRIYYTFPGAVEFFVNRADYVEKNKWVYSELGVAISSFGYILGILMTILFLVLWITSFKSIHRRMGNKRWKKVQKWAYVLYAMIFVHSITLHIGWMINMNPVRDDYSDYMTKEVIAVASTVLIFASYLILKLRKEKRKNLAKQPQ